MKLEDLSAALETLAVLEALCPVELEKHLQLNNSRLVDYDEVRAEVVS